MQHHRELNSEYFKRKLEVHCERDFHAIHAIRQKKMMRGKKMGLKLPVVFCIIILILLNFTSCQLLLNHAIILPANETSFLFKHSRLSLVNV